MYRNSKEIDHLKEFEKQVLQDFEDIRNGVVNSLTDVNVDIHTRTKNALSVLDDYAVMIDYDDYKELQALILNWEMLTCDASVIINQLKRFDFR